MSKAIKEKPPAVPTMDKRLAHTFLRIVCLAWELKNRAQFGTVQLFVDEYVVQAHNGWRIELPVKELADYFQCPDKAEYAPAPASVDEALDLLKEILTTCRRGAYGDCAAQVALREGVRGIDSPAVPKPEQLRAAEALLLRRQP